MSKNTPRAASPMHWSWKSDFYDFWDAFVKNWFLTRPKKTDKLELAFSYLGGFYFDALPEPYLGSHNKAKVVIINYNPGLSDSADTCKFFSQRTDHVVGGKENLIKSFDSKCSKSYKRFIRKWNPLTSTVDIPGRSWWAERFKWIKQIHGALSNFHGGQDTVTEKEVFCLEFCPYHSKAFKMGLLFSKSDTSESRTLLKEHILKHVLVPAINTVIKNDLPCVICVGSKIGQYFVSEFEAIVFEEKWSEGQKYKWSGKMWQPTGICEQWPPVKVCRSYELLSVDLGHSMWKGVFDKVTARKSIPILVTYTKGSNRVPAERFSRVEEAFVKRIFNQNKQQKGKQQ